MGSANSRRLCKRRSQAPAPSRQASLLAAKAYWQVRAYGPVRTVLVGAHVGASSPAPLQLRREADCPNRPAACYDLMP